LLLIAAGLVLGMVAATGCGSFRSDTAVSITSPAQMSTIQVPFTATWKSTAAPGTRYAVFVDATPMPPGQTMRVFADTGCKRVPGCYPSPELLASGGIYIANQNHCNIQTIPTAVGMTAHENPPMHTMNIILFSGTGASTQGHRIGDGVWQVEFRGANALAAFGTLGSGQNSGGC
jgi:hypothetical protein